MAGARKLQVEIERTMKRVEEGMTAFDEILERVNAAETQLQKEKLEEELKKEIKKLQRYRDNIKMWIASAEIKQKTPLEDARRNIERKMEAFKVVERETKTKAYSREGLMRDTPLSAEERKRMKSREWVRDVVDKLSEQMDEMDADIERLGASSKRKDKETVAELEALVKSHRNHVDRLEALARMLDNAAAEADQVDALRDELEDYAERARTDNLEFDDTLYEEFDLTLGREEGLSDDDLSDLDDEAAPKPPPAKAAVAAAAPAPAPAPAVLKTVPVSAVPAASTAASATKDVSNSGAASGGAAATKSGARTGGATPAPAPAPAAAAKAGDAAKAGASTTAAATPASVAARGGAAPTAAAIAASGVASSATAAAVAAKGIKPAADTAATIARSVSATAPAAATSAPATAAAAPKVNEWKAGSALSRISSGGNSAATAPSAAPAGSSSSSTAAATPAAPAPVPAPAPAPAPAAVSSTPVALPPGIPAPTAANNAAAAATPAATPVPARGGAAPSAQTSTAPAPGAPVMGRAATPGVPGGGMPAAAMPPLGMGGVLDDGASLRAALAAASIPAPSPAILETALPSLTIAQQRFNMSALQLSMTHIPEPIDSERPRQYNPRNPAPTHPAFPSTPPTAFDNPAVFSKMDLDTLLFIFYYQQGTYQQYLAARELKRLSWRFHKKYCAWFKRHEEVKEVADDRETGTYMYFDYEQGWVQRIKKDFSFEFAYLENEL